MLLLKCQLASDMGCLRANNEDMILFNGGLYRDERYEQKFELAPQARFTAFVADGMGGHEGGEFASELATQAFDRFITDLPSGLSHETLSREIKNWVDETHALIVNKGLELPQYEDMGTTFIGMFSYEGRVYMMNIGDSRLYRYRSGILKQLSADHSMRELTGDESAPSNMIYNSLGAGTSAFADFIELTGQLLDEDLFLLCSDGLSDMLTDDQIEELLQYTPTAVHLIEAAKAAGGRDNISVVLLQVTEQTDEAEVV